MTALLVILLVPVAKSPAPLEPILLYKMRCQEDSCTLTTCYILSGSYDSTSFLIRLNKKGRRT